MPRIWIHFFRNMVRICFIRQTLWIWMMEVLRHFWKVKNWQYIWNRNLSEEFFMWLELSNGFRYWVIRHPIISVFNNNPVWYCIVYMIKKYEDIAFLIKCRWLSSNCVHSSHWCEAYKSPFSKLFLRLSDKRLLTILIKKIEEDKS